MSSLSNELVELGDGLFAYVQGDGGWGLSNSGLVVSDGESLLVDTLFNGPMTRDMLAAFRRATPEAEKISTLVNTHANGDHTFGNHLVEGARIIGSRACRDEMEERPAEAFRANLENWKDNGEAGAFLHEVMGSKFDFSDISHVPPTDVFSGRMDVSIGGREVQLHEFGPAHTKGDVVAYVPSARAVFTGDLLFSGGHPIIWAGPIGNWIKACDTILAWDVETVVSGHGPVGDKQAVHEMGRYLRYVYDEATARYSAGMDYVSAAWDLAFDGFDSWIDRERVVANVANVYNELSGGKIAPERNEILGLMGRYRAGIERPHIHTASCDHDH